MTTQAPDKPTAAPAKSEQGKRITTQVMEEIEKLRAAGRVQIPSNYSVGNALNNAWFKLQEVQNLDKKFLYINGELQPIVTVNSVANALRAYVIQGMDVGKSQGAFIIYGDKLTWQRQYQGDVVLAQRVRPGIEPYYDVICEGEEVIVEKFWSRQSGFIDVIVKHTKCFPRASSKIIGAYCGFVDKETGENLGVVLFDIDRIKKSWSKSKTYKPDAKFGTHVEFEDEMCLKTVIRRRCKPIYQMSDDSALLASIIEQDMDAIDGEIADDVAANANGEMLSLSSGSIETQIPQETITQVPATEVAEAPATGVKLDF